MTDWAYQNMPRRKDEWYTLPENLYNCYTLTGDKRYLEMARAIRLQRQVLRFFCQRNQRLSSHAPRL